MVDGPVGAALDAAWREHWGQLLAVLATRLRRLDLAEEALADAFAGASRRWPVDGVPANPAGWLHTTAYRRALDLLRAEAVAGRVRPLLVVAARGELDDRQRDDADEVVADDRLRLVLLCCHPALDQQAQAALALRLVMGLPTTEIARLFLVADATMAARLTRAKRKIAQAGIPFALPDEERLPARLDAAARTVYLAFTAGYTPGSGPDLLRVDAAGEALRLGRVVDGLLPGRPVVRALLALMLLQHSRRDARQRDGRLVLLPDQDRTAWHHGEIDEALRLLAGLPPTTGYAEELRLQAAIAACHATAPTAADTDWPVVAATYRTLEELTGSPVVRLNRAVAVAEASGPAAGLALLDGLAERLPRYHRLPAITAELLVRNADMAGARDAYREAIARCGNDVERAHLRHRLAEIGD